MNTFAPTLKNSILLTIIFILWLWGIKLFETLFAIDLQQLGVYPLSTKGLVGIITAPMVHGSWQHVFGNSLPILLLGSFLHYSYPKSRYWALMMIWVISGIGVWLIGRESFHIGASGLTHGMFFYLFLMGIFRRDRRSSAVMMIAFYMYGSMLLTIFPREHWISFEYHLCGAIAGIVSALLFRHWDPKPIRKKYSWEHEEENTLAQSDLEDPVIGEQWKLSQNEESATDKQNPHQ